MEFVRPYMSLVLGEKGYIIGEVASELLSRLGEWIVYPTQVRAPGKN
jgi:hypothetical protein